MFQNYIEELSFPDDSEVVGFYYFDNSARDNPIYGKACDTFALDVRVNNEYAVQKKMYLDGAEEVGIWGMYEVFWLGTIKDSVTENMLIAFNDSTCVVRCILITDLEPNEFRNFYNVINTQTEFDWNE